MAIPLLSGIEHMNQLRPAKRKELHDYVKGEWLRTREARNGGNRDTALKNYQLYHRTEEEPDNAAAQRNEQSPASGSTLRAPLVFWGVETLLPRLVTVPPKFVVTGKTIDSHKYARAKQGRIEYYAKKANFHQRLVQSTRQTLILGNSPMKISFEPDRNVVEMHFVPWWDFYFSPEARTVRHADWIFHRTFYSKLGIEWMAGFTDADGRKTFKNMDQIPMARRDEADDTYNDRRSVDKALDHNDIPVYCVIEAWSKFGHYVAMGGSDGGVPLAIKQSPYVMPNGEPYRPFAWFGFHQNTDSPYGQGVGEIIGDHQIELEVLRNAQLEEIRGNLFAPVAALDNVDLDELEAALGVPNGIFTIDSSRYQDVRQAVQRMPPGQASTDYERARDDIRTEIQMILGISDSISGVQLPGGAQDNTATGATIRQQESNKRIQLLGIELELEMRHIVKMVDALDRQFGGEIYIRTSDLGLSDGIQPAGMEITDSMVKIGEELNEGEHDYEIEVTTGSMQQADEMETHQRMQKFIANVSHPRLEGHINWQEVATVYAELTGMGSLVLTPEERQQNQQQDLLAALQGAAQAGPGSPGAAQGEEGAGVTPTPPGPPAPPNQTGPTDR